MDGTDFPELVPLVTHETVVPGIEGNEKFTRFGEGLSYDGSAVAFWASWGDETFEFSQCCPAHGNKDRKAFCESAESGSINGTGDPIGCWYQNLTIPRHQGIFVYNDDGVGEKLRLVKKTSLDKDGIGTYLLNWNYSGKPPSAGSHRVLEDSDAAGEQSVCMSISSVFQCSI